MQSKDEARADGSAAENKPEAAREVKPSRRLVMHCALINGAANCGALAIDAADGEVWCATIAPELINCPKCIEFIPRQFRLPQHWKALEDAAAASEFEAAGGAEELTFWAIRKLDLGDVQLWRDKYFRAYWADRPTERVTWEQLQVLELGDYPGLLETLKREELTVLKKFMHYDEVRP